MSRTQLVRSIFSSAVSAAKLNASPLGINALLCGGIGLRLSDMRVHSGWIAPFHDHPSLHAGTGRESFHNLAPIGRPGSMGAARSNDPQCGGPQPMADADNQAAATGPLAASRKTPPPVRLSDSPVRGTRSQTGAVVKELASSEESVGH